MTDQIFQNNKIICQESNINKWSPVCIFTHSVIYLWSYFWRGWSQLDGTLLIRSGCVCFAYLKHSRRSCRAYLPAWYSCPSITAVTVSESSTITATSLSRFPSMLRSLMLAEPCKEEGGVSWSASRGRQSTGLVAGLVADWLRRVHFKSRLWNSEGKSEFFEKFMILCFITESLPTKQEMWI